MSDTKYFNFQFKKLKDNYPRFNKISDPYLFTLLCSKYFFFNEPSIAYDQDIAFDSLTDGSKDGGIDAIFNDPTSDANDIIVVQSKYYDKTPVSADQVVGELYKINETIKNLKSNKVANYSDKVVTAFRNATSLMEDNGNYRVYFFTSYQPSSKKDRSKMQKSIANYFKDFNELVLIFEDDIKAQIELCENGKLFVDYDKLILDDKDNYLEYEDSVIVNISAKSLQDLQNRRRNGLLGLNLRYHVSNKKVDF